MQNMSTEMRAALGAGLHRPRGHKTVSRAELIINNRIKKKRIPIKAGRISVDSRAQVRRSLQGLVIVDTSGELIPETASDDLSPTNGAMLRVYRGIDWEDGVDHSSGQFPVGLELLPQGTFVLYDVDVTHSTDGVVIECNGYDAARLVQENKFVFAYHAPAGNTAQNIVDLITDRYPRAVINAADDSSTMNKQIIDAGDSSDPLATANKWAAAAGMELFVDQLGTFVLRQIPSYRASQAVWRFADGGLGGLKQITKKSSREDVINGWKVSGEATGNAAPVTAMVWDDDPDSPTYYQGRFGRKPGFFSSPTLTTVEQCQTAGEGRLARSADGTEDATLTITPHYALEEQDVFSVTDDKLKVDTHYVVDSMDVQLGTGDMTIASRRRHIAAN